MGVDQNGLCSKLRTSDKGHQWGGAKFSRGLLYKLLSNPVYIGRIKHKDVVYEGQHEAVISLELWNEVQALREEQAATARGSRKSSPIGNLLRGLIFDIEGNKYAPSFTNKGKRQYRYYVSQTLLQNRTPPPGIITRLSAHETEMAFENALKNELLTIDSAKELFALESDEHHNLLQNIVENSEKLQMRHLITKSVSKVVIGLESVKIHVDRKKLLSEICHLLNLPMPQLIEGDITAITIPIETIKPKTGSFVIEPRRNNAHDPFDRPPQELKNWVRGVIWRERHFSGMTIRQIAQEADCSESLVGNMIAESFKAA